MKPLLVGLLACVVAFGHGGTGTVCCGSDISIAEYNTHRSWHKAWKVSAAVLGAVSIADGVSSNGLSERNPLLGRGEFGSRQVSIKAAIVAVALVGQWWAVKKKPELERVFVFTNVGVAGLTSWAVVHNVKASQ